MIKWFACLAIMISLGCRHGNEEHASQEANIVDGTPKIVFHDRTTSSGIAFAYSSGGHNTNSILESLGGGVGIIDYELDGNPDLFFPGGGELNVGETPVPLVNQLCRQVDVWKFQEVSGKASVKESKHYTHGCEIADFDNDGFDDVLVTGYGGVQLFRNQGDGTFASVAAQVGLTDSNWSSSAAWGDLNSDGLLDLYISHYVDWSWDNDPQCASSSGEPDICPPRSFSGLDDVVYLSSGDGTFVESSKTLGLRPKGKGLGVVTADFDIDGDTDVYVTNDTVDNFFYENDGGGTLVETGTVSGLATDDRGVPNGSMGIAVLDYDADAQPDAWVTNYENESFGLYRNNGNATFTHVSQSVGIFAIASTYVGFGTVAFDIDYDGDEDLVVSNGHAIRRPQSGQVEQMPLLLLNSDGNFELHQSPNDSYFGKKHFGRGVAKADFNSDGRTDLVFSHNNSDAIVLENLSEIQGNWLQLRLIGTESNRTAIGAHAYLKTTSGVQYRTLVGGGSYLSSSERCIHWGVPEGVHVESMLIVWPGGRRQEVPVTRMNQRMTIVEKTKL
ncbi:MAG: CRTAC1 family protein [Pirellulaceae bacterium]